MTREGKGVGSLTLCINVLEELEEVLSLLQGVRGEINVRHNWRSHDCRDGSQAEEDLGKHLDVFEKTSCVSVKEDAVGECLGDESSSAVMRRVEYPRTAPTMKYLYYKKAQVTSIWASMDIMVWWYPGYCTARCRAHGDPVVEIPHYHSPRAPERERESMIH